MFNNDDRYGNNMIDIERLYKGFSKHVATCKSAPVVCNINAAFESWFRVELIPVLYELGYPYSQIKTNYTYPDGKKADLCVESEQGDIVFELKPFVSNADANKINNYPSQIKRLEKLVSSEHRVLQVITFTTFIGYSEKRMNTLMNLFFTNVSWNIYGPKKLIDQYSLFVVITSITN